MKKEERGLTLMHLNWWFGIGAIFVPAIVRKNLSGMSSVPVKGVMEKQHQEKLNLSIGSAVNCYAQTYAGKTCMKATWKLIL